MKKFKTYLSELVDPVDFIKRASRRFGTTLDYGNFYAPAPPGEHVPLAGFDHETATKVHDKLFSVRWLLGGIPGARRHETQKTFKINELNPTQPYNYTGDEDILRVKMAQTNPSNVFIVTHDGEDYVIDGHHAVMGARLRGDKTITSRHLNLDDYPDDDQPAAETFEE